MDDKLRKQIERERDAGFFACKKLRGQVDKLRAALAAAGIPAQARLDDKGPPLRITVERAREIVGMVDHG